MPTTDPIYMRKATILAKLETAPGTDALPAAANAMRVKDFTLTPMEGTELEYTQIQPYFGNFDGEMVGLTRKLDMTVYLAGSGAAGTPPVFDPLLQVCGHAVTTAAGVSVTYTPISAAIKAASIYTNIDGQNYRMVGSRGTVQLTTDPQNYPVAKFSLRGIWLPVQDATLPVAAPAASARAVPVDADNTTLSLHGLALRASAFGLDVGAAVKERFLIGYQGVHLHDRKSTWSATFESVPASAKNWELLAQQGTTGALALVHGLTAGNVLTLNAAKVNVGKPSISDSDGISMTQLTGKVIPSSAGNDEYSLAFT